MTETSIEDNVMLQQNKIGWLDLSQGAQLVLPASFQLPLSTIKEVSDATGHKDNLVREAVGQLEAASLLEGDKMGWGCPPVMRRYLSISGLEVLAIAGPTWHDEGNRCLLFGRLPLVQAFYRMIPSVQNLGGFRNLQWITGLGLDAAVEFERGWIVLLWSGALEKESVIQARLEKLWRDFRVLAATDQPPWPAMVCFVVPDHWQKELVLRVLRRLEWQPNNTTIWCLENENPPEIVVHIGSRGSIHRPVIRRGTGAWSWKKRLKDSPWATGQQELAKSLDLLVEWGPIHPAWAHKATNKGEKSKTTQRAFSKLADLELARTEQQGRIVLHLPTNPAYNKLASRDGVNFSEVNRNDPRLAHHEDVVRYLAMLFLAAGIPTACGYRSTEGLGEGSTEDMGEGSTEDMGEEGGGIAPDLMVFLENSPFGPSWFYVEIEFSARGQKKVSNKFGGYGSGLRQDDYPVLAVSGGALAESVFQQVARDLGVRMLTTTEKRLRRFGPLNNTDCWSWNGQNVVIGGPEQDQQDQQDQQDEEDEEEE